MGIRIGADAVNYQRKIENLEMAVLHMMRAVNSLSAAVEAERDEKRGKPKGGLLGAGDPDALVQEARKHLQLALEVFENA